MRKLFALAVATLTATALVPTASTAGGGNEVAITYVANGVLTVNGGALGLPVGIGGYAFPEGKIRRFRLEDLNGENVGFSLCQETTPDDPADTGCGNGEDPLWRACATTDWQQIPEFFRDDLPTWLFVDIAPLDCDQGGLAGIATMQYR